MKYIFRAIVTGAFVVWGVMNADLEGKKDAADQVARVDMVVKEILGDGELDSVLSNLREAGGNPGVYNLCNGLFEKIPTECIDGYRVKSTVSLPSGIINLQRNKISLLVFFSSDMQMSSYQFDPLR